MEFISFNEFCEKANSIFEKNSLNGYLNQERIEKLYALTLRMLEVNASMNLTAITDADGIILKHYADSLTVAKLIPENASLIDVGCGAGFPTLPLAIFRNDLKITALDGTAKRIKYLGETAEMLSLTNVTAISARAEELGRDKGYREFFDVATARAVASMPILTELCLPFVKKGGLFLAMKASRGAEELALAKNAIARCGGTLLGADDFLLSSEHLSEPRVIISVKKTALTPAAYPRHYAQISKKPL